MTTSRLCKKRPSCILTDSSGTAYLADVLFVGHLPGIFNVQPHLQFSRSLLFQKPSMCMVSSRLPGIRNVLCPPSLQSTPNSSSDDQLCSSKTPIIVTMVNVFQFPRCNVVLKVSVLQYSDPMEYENFSPF